MTASGHIKTMKVSTDTAAGLTVWAVVYIACIAVIGLLLMIMFGRGSWIARVTDLKMLAVAVPGGLGLAALIVPIVSSTFAPRGTWMFDRQGITYTRRNRLPVQIDWREVDRIYWSGTAIRIKGKRRTIPMGSIFLTKPEWDAVRSLLLVAALGESFAFPADNRSHWIVRSEPSGNASVGGGGSGGDGGGEGGETSPAADDARTKAEKYARHYD